MANNWQTNEEDALAKAINNSLMVNQRLPNNSGVRVDYKKLNGGIAPDAAFEQACALSLACEQNPGGARDTTLSLVKILSKLKLGTNLLSHAQSYAKDLNALLHKLLVNDEINDDVLYLFIEFFEVVNRLKRARTTWSSELNQNEMCAVISIDCWRFVAHFLTLASRHDIINIFNNENITNTIFPYLLIENNISEKQAQNFINEMVLILHP